jgi:hypothetical protein
MKPTQRPVARPTVDAVAEPTPKKLSAKERKIAERDSPKVKEAKRVLDQMSESLASEGALPPRRARRCGWARSRARSARSTSGRSRSPRSPRTPPTGTTCSPRAGSGEDPPRRPQAEGGQVNDALAAAWRHFIDEHSDEHVTALAVAMFAAGARWAAADPSRRPSCDGHTLRA